MMKKKQSMKRMVLTVAAVTLMMSFAAPAAMAAPAVYQDQAVYEDQQAQFLCDPACAVALMCQARPDLCTPKKYLPEFYPA